MDTNSTGGFQNEFIDAYRDQAQKLGRFNLAVFGKTGAGKSSLVNAIFGESVARTGIGKPVSAGTTYYEHPSGNFGMFDCVGFETGESGDQILGALRSTVEDLRGRPITEQIHVVWYVLRWSDRRFEDTQVDFIRELRRMGLPVVMVLSQVPVLADGQPHPEAQVLADLIAQEMGDEIVTGRPLMTNSVADPHLSQPVHGLMPLLEATFRAAPNGVREALVAVQRIDSAIKRRECHGIIATASGAAAGIGAVPIPFADVALLLPTQVTMMATVATRYALPVDAGTVGSLAVAATLAGGTASWAGRGLANMLKMIPGVGSAAGGAINATVAATLTTAIGYAWLAVCEFLATQTPEQIERHLRDGSTLRARFYDEFRNLGRNPEEDDGPEHTAA